MTPRLGDVLIDLGFITPEQLRTGLERQQRDRRRLGEVLISMGIIQEEKLVKALRRQIGVDEWDPRRAPVHERVIAMFPAELAIRHRVFPVAIRRNSIGVTWCIATTDPTDEATRNEIGRSLCTPDEPVTITWLVATASNIEDAIGRHYSIPDDRDPVIRIEDPVEHPSTDQSRAQLARIRIAKKEPCPEDDSN